MRHYPPRRLVCLTEETVETPAETAEAGGEETPEAEPTATTEPTTFQLSRELFSTFRIGEPVAG